MTTVNSGSLIARFYMKVCSTCGSCFDHTEEICEVDGNSLNSPLPVERIIDDQYRLERRLGQGGMGTVFEATDISSNRKFAIKVLHMYGDQDALKRFQREAHTSLTLKHPNIISVYAYGELNPVGGYLVMERFQGETLHTRLHDKGPFAPDEAALIFHQICDGLMAAHQKNIIHRDLKPENIFLSLDHEQSVVVKIFDFGLAKVLTGEVEGTNITTPGTVLGTLGYMSPEQLLGEEADQRSDIFSLGVMVAEALTGEKPFDGLTIMQMMSATLKEIFHLPGKTPAALHLNDVLQKCMAKRRRERYNSVAELQNELIPAILNYRA